MGATLCKLVFWEKNNKSCFHEKKIITHKLQLTVDNSNSQGTLKKVRPIESSGFRKV